MQPFGQADERNASTAAVATDSALRIGVADVLGGEDHHPAQHEQRILAGLEHARHPVDRGVGIGAAHALDERRDDAVVLVAGLVVEQRPLLQRLLDRRPASAACARRRVGRRAPRRPPPASRARAARRRAASRATSSRTSSGHVERPARPRPRSCRRARDRRARAARPPRARRSTTTFARDSSAAFTSNDGFSVVAPTSVTVPASTCGSSASCCALLKRWISSMNSTVRSSRWSRRSAALAIASRSSFTPAITADSGTKRAPASRRQQPRQRRLARARRPPQDQRRQLLRLAAPAAAACPGRAAAPARRTPRASRGRIRSASGCPRRSFAAERANRSMRASLARDGRRRLEGAAATAAGASSST